MSDDTTTSNTGTVADTGFVDHSADESAYAMGQRPGTGAVLSLGDPARAEQPNPMAHWLMIIESIAAGFRHLGSLSPMHAPLAGFAARIEADLAALKTLL